MTLFTHLTTKNTAFFSACNDSDISKTIAALLSIRKILPGAKLFILSRSISTSNLKSLSNANINYIDLDLRGKFNRQWTQPTEYYYLFAGPELLKKQNFKYSIYINNNINCIADPLKYYKKITGIAGFPSSKYFEKFLTDVEKIQQTFNIEKNNLEKTSIQSDIIYFNNLSMKQKHLLETASTLFKQCLSLNMPRKDNDSLFALLQLTSFENCEKVFLKEKKCFILKSFKTYTKTPTEENSVLKRYFIPKPQYLVNSKKPPIKAFISEDEHLGIFNFGDEFPKDLIPTIFGYNIIPCNNIEDAELFSVGSVLFGIQHIKQKPFYCWGSGFISQEKIDHELEFIKPINFTAVRGKQTLNRIAPIHPKNIPLGDPGILVNLVFPASKPTDLIGIIPHYVDVDHPFVEQLRSDKRFLIINPLDSPREVAKQISMCRFIFSSSLHGLIFSDSYNIPNAHVTFSDKVYGGEYKFKDYDSGVDKKHLDADYHKITDFDYIKSLEKQYQPIPNLAKKQQDLIDAFPKIH